MFGPPLSVTNTAAKSSSVNASGPNGEILVAVTPDIMIYGAVQCRENCVMISEGHRW